MRSESHKENSINLLTATPDVWMEYVEARVKRNASNPLNKFSPSSNFQTEFNQRIQEEDQLDQISQELRNIFTLMFQYLIANYNNAFPRSYASTKPLLKGWVLNFGGKGVWETVSITKQLVELLIQDLTLNELMEILRLGRIESSVITMAFELLYAQASDKNTTHKKDTPVPLFKDLDVKEIRKNYWASQVANNILGIAEKTSHNEKVLNYFGGIGLPAPEQEKIMIKAMDELLARQDLEEIGLRISQTALGQIVVVVEKSELLRTALHEHSRRAEEIVEEVFAEFVKGLEGLDNINAPRPDHVHYYMGRYLPQGLLALIQQGKASVTAEELFEKARDIFRSQPKRRALLTLGLYEKEELAEIDKLIQSVYHTLKSEKILMMSKDSRTLLEELLLTSSNRLEMKESDNDENHSDRIDNLYSES